MLKRKSLRVSIVGENLVDALRRYREELASATQAGQDEPASILEEEPNAGSVDLLESDPRGLDLREIDGEDTIPQFRYAILR